MSVVQVSVYVCMCLCACACLEEERECLQSMAKVQQSNSFRKEAVPEPGGLTPDALQPPAWGEELEESVCGVSGVLHDVEGPPPTSCCIKVCDGRKHAPHSPLCCPYHPLQSLPLNNSTAAEPHSDTGAEDTLHRAVIEAPKSSSPQLPEEVETLVGLPNQPGGVGSPGKVLCYIHTQIPETRNHFHNYSSDVQGRRRAPVSSEVHHHLHQYKDTATTMFHCRHHAFFFVFLTFATPYSFEAISSKNIYLGLITPEYRFPVVFIFVSMGPGKL